MSEPQIPDELTSAVRAAADGAPGYQGDLAAIQRRGRAHRRHRVAAVTGFAAVAAATAIAVPWMVSGPAPTANSPASAVPSASTEPDPPETAQRLVFNGTGGLRTDVDLAQGLTTRELYEQYRDNPDVSGQLGYRATEVLPDGSVEDLGLDSESIGVDSIQAMAAMPDGRLAVLGRIGAFPEDLERAEATCAEDLEYPLVVLEADGSVSESRDVRVPCEAVALVSADAEAAYLIRDSLLVAHDLATGDERVLADTATTPPEGACADYAGERLVEVVEPRRAPPAIVILAVATGATSEFPLTGGDLCRGVRVSPDGRYAAVAVHRPFDDRDDLRVRIVALDSGEVARDELIRKPDGGNEAVLGGLAWRDDRSLQVAWYEVASLYEGELQWIPDLVEVTAVQP